MILVVTGVGFLIHAYSTGYMAHEGGYFRFFGYLNLFMFAMLMLVLANNFLLLFVGWEGVGTCSYLLIGFYFHKKSASDAGKKAFIVNRIGDAAFLLGIFMTSALLGTIRFADIGPALAKGNFNVGDPRIVAIALLFFVGATGKSAQIPLYVWLPDAMEGPTPVSALIHAATMVTAGVYMVTRTSAIYQLAPAAMAVVALVGAVTALFAASMGVVQTDIKKVLAYSTVSQLGYMFLACGRGRPSPPEFFSSDDPRVSSKACYFSPPAARSTHSPASKDMRKNGRALEKSPSPYWTMLIATLAICRNFSVRCGFLEQRPHPRQGLRKRRAPLGHWLFHRRHVGLILVAPDFHDVGWTFARRPRSGASHPRIAALDAGSARSSRRPFHRGRLGRMAGNFRRK